MANHRPGARVQDGPQRAALVKGGAHLRAQGGAQLGRVAHLDLLVVQDGENDGQNQNYKLVDWGDVIGPDGGSR